MPRHSQTRAQERSGIALSTYDLRKIVGKIRDGDCIFLYKSNRLHSVFCVYYDGKLLFPVYRNNKNKPKSYKKIEDRIKTFLSSIMIEDNMNLKTKIVT